MLAKTCRSSRCLRSFRCYAKDPSCRQVLPIKRRWYHDTSIAFHSSSNNNNLSTAASSFVLYDSLSQSLKEIPVMVNHDKQHDKPKALAWYTCGPTTYSAMHLGHARTYVWLDMMRRVLEWVCAAKGAPPPLFVMNITDVDDKIIAAAQEEDALTISRRSEAHFWKDMERLGCQKPHITTRVTEYVDSDIVPYIQRLVQQDMAYVVGTDGVYFDVQSFEEKLKGTSQYGKLAGGAVKSSSPESSSEMETDANTESSSTTKRDRRDFALWKLRKEGEDVFWESPWGHGRPGWHIECSAMIEAVQKQFQDTHTFLVHAGGVDLKFPHHTNEIAQAEAYHYSSHAGESCSCPSTQQLNADSEWIPHWIHTGHLMVKDDKMSKSLKNFLTVDELWFDFDKATSSSLDSPADDFRLWCLLGGSYGHREEYSRSKIRGARQKREKILRFLLDGESWLQQQKQKNSLDADGKIQSHSKRWTEEDHSLLVSIQRATQEAHQALLNNMRGTAYVEGLVKIAEAGSAHIRQHDASNAQVIEHIKVGLQATRDLLSLLGFSDLTVRAGLLKDFSEDSRSDGASTISGNSYIVGGETAVIEEMLNFRAAIRKAALAEVKSKKGADCDGAKEILKACDALRDNLPKIGIEAMDTGKDQASTWRFCVPKQDEKRP